MLTDLDEKLREDEYLKGRQNYYSWLRNFNNYCFLESYYDSTTNVYLTTAVAVKAMKKWIHKRLGNGPARQFFHVSQTIPEILAEFNQEFGSGFADPDTLIDAIKNLFRF